MGTRGILGFRIDSTDKLAYNHFDSYPSGLGTTIQRWLRESSLDDVKAQVRALRVVAADTKPSPEDIEALQPWTNLNVSSQCTQDWYCLLHNTQGDPGATLQAGVIVDSASFVADSLFCEWAYVVNFDDSAIEVYRGFQKAPHSDGRYAAETADRGYYPIALVRVIPFSDLPGFEMASLEACNEADAA